MTRIPIAALIASFCVASPALADDAALVRVCTQFLDRYEAAVARFDVSDRAQRLRRHQFRHIWRRAHRTAAFCDSLLVDADAQATPEFAGDPVVRVVLDELRLAFRLED